MPYTDVNLMGFSIENSASDNRRILQEALDKGGTVIISEPGIYNIDSYLTIGSYTTLECANGAAIRKTASPDGFAHVLINKGAFNKEWNEHIIIRGLKIIVNNVMGSVCVQGLRGQLAFHCVRDLRLDDIRILDIDPPNYAVHICTFEDIIITNCIFKGKKDGIHLGCGRRFYIGNCVFQTYDDAVALNGHDYDTGNPHLGFIEDGVVEKCYDLNDVSTTGFFCRVLAGAWVDWFEGMEVQKSDSVVSNGRLYRVFADPDGKKFISKTRPAHESGHMLLDGIDWMMTQEPPVYAAGVRNVTFRDIYLYKPRTSFALNFECDRYCRSFYPGAVKPLQKQLVFDNVRVLHDGEDDFISAVTPIDSMLVANCSLKNNKITFRNPAGLDDLGVTKLTISNCTAESGDIESLINNAADGKSIELTIDAEKKGV